MDQNLQRSLQLAIMVVSCDNYADLWRPFFLLFRRFWPDCPYKVYLLSNFNRIEEEDVVPILVEEDGSWSDNLIRALNLIDEEYMLMIIDDLFLINHVCRENLQEVFAWIAREEPNYVRLNPVPRPDTPYNHLVGIVSSGTLYRTATVMSVWKKTVLLDLLKPGENAWEFEIHGTIRSDNYDGFFSTYQCQIPFINGVVKGRWTRAAVRRLGSLGIPLQLDKRRVMTLWETVVFSVVLLRSKGLQLFPSRYRRLIKELVTAGRCNYSLKK